jgi:hypothetical protein
MADTDDITRDIAPDVNPQWADAFVVELRLAGVSGRDIGAALAEVESHVAASGLDVQETFGDPRAYAQALDLRSDPSQSPREIARLVWPILVQVAGM